MRMLFTLFLFVLLPSPLFFFFFFNDTATTEIYTLSLHDALPISGESAWRCRPPPCHRPGPGRRAPRSEEHTSELQSPCNLVCRLLLEKKKKKEKITIMQNKKYHEHQPRTNIMHGASI